MLDIEINITIEGDDTETPLLDTYEVDMLLDTTRAQIRQHIQQRLGGYVCEEHDQAPRIVVTGTYSLDTEQLDYTYNIEACCNLMTMRTAALLARV